MGRGTSSHLTLTAGLRGVPDLAADGDQNGGYIGGASAPAVMYHVAPVGDRAAILAGGLRPHDPGWGDMPTAVYLWPTLNDAQRWTAVASDDRWPDAVSRGSDDIWQVDVGELQLADDTHTPPAYIHLAAISAARLKLVT